MSTSLAEVSLQQMDKASNNIEGTSNTQNTTDTPTIGNEDEPKDVETFQVSKRAKTSLVWSEFNIISLPNSVKKAECIHCKAKLAVLKSSSTSHL